MVSRRSWAASMRYQAFSMWRSSCIMGRA
jgi:hypothetical protein